LTLKKVHKVKLAGKLRYGLAKVDEKRIRQPATKQIQQIQQIYEQKFQRSQNGKCLTPTHLLNACPLVGKMVIFCS